MPAVLPTTTYTYIDTYTHTHIRITPQQRNMAPIAIDEQANGHANGTLNAKAVAFTPAAQQASPYHAASSESAMSAEASFAAHNYHPLPIVFAKAQAAPYGTLRASTISTSSQHTRL